MIDIIHRIGIKSPITQVYKALTSIEGLSHWWTEEVNGDEQPGGKIEFRFHSLTGELKGSLVMEVVEHNTPTDVRWRCIEGPDEWEPISLFIYHSNMTRLFYSSVTETGVRQLSLHLTAV